MPPDSPPVAPSDGLSINIGGNQSPARNPSYRAALTFMPKQIAFTFWSLVAGCVFSFGVVAVMIAH